MWAAFLQNASTSFSSIGVLLSVVRSRNRTLSRTSACNRVRSSYRLESNAHAHQPISDLHRVVAPYLHKCKLHAAQRREVQDVGERADMVKMQRQRKLLRARVVQHREDVPWLIAGLAQRRVETFDVTAQREVQSVTSDFNPRQPTCFTLGILPSAIPTPSRIDWWSFYKSRC